MRPGDSSGCAGDDIVFTRSGTSVEADRMYRRGTPEFAIVAEVMRSARLDQDVDPRLLLRYFDSPGFQLIVIDVQTVLDWHRYLRLADRWTVESPLPDLQSSEAIASMLGALDDKIAVNDRITRNSARSCCKLALRSCMSHDADREARHVRDLDRARNTVRPSRNAIAVYWTEIPRISAVDGISIDGIKLPLSQMVLGNRSMERIGAQTLDQSRGRSGGRVPADSTPIGSM